MSKRVEPLKKILDLYRELNSAERKACIAAMQVFAGEPTKPQTEKKAKPVTGAQA